MNCKHLWSAMVILVMLSCNKDKLTNTNKDVNLYPKLSLTDPQAGQMAKYARISLPADDTIPSFYADTLVLKVTKVVNSTIFVEEGLSNGSLSKQQLSAVPFPDLVFNYSLKSTATALEIQSVGPAFNTRLFPSLDDKEHALAYPSNSAATTKLKGVRVDAAYLPIDRTLQIVGSQSQLVANLNHQRRQHGLPGFTFVHDPQSGLQIMLKEQNLDGEAIGWQRLD